jgi:hypothetical protein
MAAGGKPPHAGSRDPVVVCDLTASYRCSILGEVFRVRLLATLAVAVSLTAGNFAMCAGWQSTPAARMACCDGEAACPEHLPVTQIPSGHAHGPNRAATQGEADQCCASAEEHSAAVAGSTFVLPGSLTPAQSPGVDLLPALRSFVYIRGAAVPLAPSAIPKHLLLSVFLV